MKNLEEIRAFFAEDKYATEVTGIEIVEAGEHGYSKVKLKIDGRHKNAIGEVMGAVYYTMADFAFAVATNSNPVYGNTVSLTSNIQYLHPARTENMYATAKAVKKEGKTSVYNITITDDNDSVIAVVTTTGYVIPFK
ncbi:PaaI family thioesterase [Eubacterium xylanophilum]|uniref:PaaI family thioesterase n=1 Tax=Eubacterium xylanophilum TaxID=39497 RepID=UPI00047DC20B|nr:PaaI family thioesterase [Eubacterium xylanophilum]